MSRYLAFKRSEFLKNAATLITGTILAQVITIITAPILTRLYLPEHYGIFGVFVAITTLLGVLSTLQYSTAIILPEKNEDAILILKGSILIAVFISIFFFGIITLGHKYFHQFELLQGLNSALYLIPISTFCVGFNTSIVSFANRYKKYKIVSLSRVISAIGGAIITFLYFFLFGAGPLGLIIGYVVSQLLSLIIIIIPFKSHFSRAANFNSREIFSILKRYKNFPKYSLITDFINGLINQLPIFLLARLSGKSSVGFYNMSNRMLGLPIVTISSGFSEVFRQRAAADFNKFGNCVQVFNKTAKSLIFISVIPFMCIMIFGADIFSFVFGANWRIAGLYSQIMGIMFFFRFIVSPLTFVYYIRGKQQEDFILHILMVVMGLFSLYFGYRLFNSTTIMLFCYSLSYSLIYLIYFFRSYQLAKGISNE